ncbi:MAG: hypothetical protein K2Y01_04185, partial [Rhabdochlamydiaceae bacterium]|nr:hypothetical protein [Rhabdochlamydiaceae bacterium]
MLCYSKALSTLINEKSTNLENLVQLSPFQRNMLLKDYATAVQKLKEHKVSFDALSNLKTSYPQYQLETILSQSTNVIKLLNAGITFDAISKLVGDQR